MNASRALGFLAACFLGQFSCQVAAITCVRAENSVLQEPLCLVRVVSHEPFPSPYGPKTAEEPCVAGTATVALLSCNQVVTDQVRTFEVCGNWQQPGAVGEQYLLWIEGMSIGACNSVAVPLAKSDLARRFLELLAQEADDLTVLQEQRRQAAELGLPGFPKPGSGESTD